MLSYPKLNRETVDYLLDNFDKFPFTAHRCRLTNKHVEEFLIIYGGYVFKIGMFCDTVFHVQVDRQRVLSDVLTHENLTHLDQDWKFYLNDLTVFYDWKFNLKIVGYDVRRQIKELKKNVIEN